MLKYEDKTKTERQLKGISIWRNNGAKGTLNYVPRFGKTEVIRKVVDKTKKNNNSISICMLVPTEIAYQNLKSIAKTYNCELYTYNVILNKMHDGFKFKYDLLIVDEIHKFLKDKAYITLSKIVAKWKLGLTGSILTSMNKDKLAKIDFPVVDIINEKIAIENNWIADYNEYNVAIHLSEIEKETFANLTNNIYKISTNFKTIYKRVNSAFGYELFKSDFELLQSLYSGKQTYNSNFVKGEYIPPYKLREIVAYIQGYKRNAIIDNELTKQIQTFWNPSNIEEQAKSYIRAVTARNDYLKYNIHKIHAVMKLCKRINKPTIIYNDSIDMIDHLHKEIKDSVKYHSQIESVYQYDENNNIIVYKTGDKQGEPKLFGKTYLKQKAIEAISNGSKRFLITGRSLSESLNLPNVEFIICTAGDNNPVTYDQRVARGKTINPDNKSKRCTIINLFINDFEYNGQYIHSRDKEKLITRQLNVDNVIWLENLNDFLAYLNN